ncbi:MAG TPA: TonB family protein [Pyrinomonadaceae bacterium]|nr:TonB family protein [Pyrinomonadaceae bacterium]
MLDQLVESKNNSAENTRRSEFLLGVFIIAVTALLSAWTYSLFAKDYGMGSGDLDISSLVAPVALPEDAPPPPPEVKQEKTQKSNSDEIVVKEMYADINRVIDLKDTSKGEKQVYSVENLDKSRLKKGDAVSMPENAARKSDGDGSGLSTSGTTTKSDDDDFDKPVVVKTPAPTPKPVPKVISGGVVNGKATNLVKPPYPAAARAVRASGAVNVQVTIDENGSVISASAVSGHPLLRAAAVQAARSSRFSPTLLSGQPVKVTGVIVYNFQP